MSKLKLTLILLCGSLVPATVVAQLFHRLSRDEAETLGQKLALGEKLLEKPRAERIWGIADTVHSSQNHRLLGTATRVCLDGRAYRKQGEYFSQETNLATQDWARVPHDREWLVTAAHVVDANLKTLEGSDKSPYTVEMIEPLADLALLSTPARGRPCVAIAQSLVLMLSYDIEATLPTRERVAELELEAPDLGELKIQNWRFKTVVGSTLSPGMPGRDDTGHVFTLLAQGRRGQSGGALLGLAGELTSWRLQSPFSSLKSDAYRRLVGMVLAVDQEGRRMAALPGPTIYRLLRAHFSRSPDAPEVRLPLTALRVNGGTAYPELQAIHYRDWIPQAKGAGLSDSGTGGLADGGTGGLADGGTGGLADGGTGGLADGGTGGLADGGSGRHNARAFSGLVQGKRRWLQINNEWSEFEALPPATREKLRSPETLKGIYEEAGQLKISDAQTPLLSWLVIPDALSNSVERFDFSSEEKYATREKNCYLSAAMSRLARTQKSRGRWVVICQSASTMGSEFWLRVMNSEKKSRETVVHLQLVRACEDGKSECNLTLKGLVWKNLPQQTSPLNRALGESQKIFAKLDPGRATVLSSTGLRSFGADGLSFTVARFGGYRLETSQGRDTEILSGPMSLNTDVFLQAPGLEREDSR